MLRRSHDVRRAYRKELRVFSDTFSRKLLFIYVWPVVLTVNIVATTSWRTKLLTSSLYILFLAVISGIAVVRSPTSSWNDVLVLWEISNLIPTVLLIGFLNRSVRAVGPLVLIFMVLAIAGGTIAPAIVGSSDYLLRFVIGIGVAVGLGAHVFIAMTMFGVAVFGVGGWFSVKWMKRRYERKKASDQSITVDAIWLLFGVVHPMFLVFEGSLWFLSGIVAFAIFKIIVVTSFSILNKADPIRKGTTLLLLRVFSLGKRSERLFDAVTLHWRYAGSINLIAGPDLATTTVEPHEFLDFLSGKLSRRFIDSAQTLDHRISEMDTEPDMDRRYRVNDFFCHDDTWKMVLSRLVRENNAVLMDLRGFSSQKAGCIYEIEELMNLVPLKQVVFIIDGTTDESFLRNIMNLSWNRMRTTSPNRTSPTESVFLFRFMGSRSGELQSLLRGLCEAAA